ncbi:MAG TPA: VOC family protein [Candidatus Dormibacteraeota bacterium]|nr:VOC family protein [Candidatus Dormibacteraeota bacterium]
MLDQIDLIVGDVPRVAEFLRDAVGLEMAVSMEEFAELRAGEMTVMLSRIVPGPAEMARGLILHVRVDDVDAAIERARGQGAEVLVEPRPTGRGWELAIIRGPEGTLVDFYRQVRAPGAG